MKARWIFWSCLILPAKLGLAQLSPALVESRSGQFVVSRVGGLATRPANNASASAKVRHLVPDLLAVSSERIKHGLLRELNIPERGGNKIYITIRPNAPHDRPIDFLASRNLDGWQYWLEFPEQMEEEQVIRAIVQTLLLELANRHAGQRSAEVPLWLVEGLTQRLVASSETDLILEPQPGESKSGSGSSPNVLWVWKQVGINNQGIKRDLLFDVRRILGNNAPLSFNDLSLPEADQFDGFKWEIYKGCAQLFVHQLLSLNAGQNSLRSMLNILPRYLNWQTAFLNAFGETFGSLRDVEKWWAITLANFTGRDQWQMWPPDVSLERLNATLILPIQVHSTTNELATRTEMSLQDIIRELDFGRQRIFLSRTLNQLVVLRARILPELVPLLDEYCHLLEFYLQTRGQAGFAAERRGQPSIDSKMLVQDTLRKLTILDQQRRAWKRASEESIKVSSAPSQQPDASKPDGR
jgi:hypothetical protein